MIERVPDGTPRQPRPPLPPGGYNAPWVRVYLPAGQIFKATLFVIVFQILIGLAVLLMVAGYVRSLTAG